MVKTHFYISLLLFIGSSFSVAGFSANSHTLSLSTSKSNNQFHSFQRISSKHHYNAKRQPHKPPQSSPSALQIATNLQGGAFLTSMTSTAAPPGLLPAIFSPLSSALGFMIWDNNWRGSAFSLNLVKNIIASSFFFMILLTRQNVPNILTQSLPLLPLTISAFLGVVIGDCTAIAALRRLGSRRYLLIDCLKPALSVLIGVIALGEKLSTRAVVGITSIVAGVYIASIQKMEDNNSNAPSEENSTSIGIGYAYAVGHLIFDTIGAAITKKCMAGKSSLGPLSVGLLRFGAAAIMLQLIGLSAKLFHSITRKKSQDNKDQWWNLPKTISSSDTATPSSLSKQYMTTGNWEAIALGTFFVTFLGPSLFYRSLQFMTLGVGVTLSCTAPLYEPILAKFLKGTNMNGKAVLGAVMAFFGVAVLSLYS